MPAHARVTHCLSACAVVLLLAAWWPAAVPAQNTPQTPEETTLDAPTFAGTLAKARAGDPEAQCEAGVAYLNGDRVAQDFHQGLSWLTQASDAGFGYARYVLADVYSRGIAGVQVDDENTYYYASLAAASSTLSDKYRERAVKLREASAKRLSVAQLANLQAKAALAPLTPMAETAK